jgi:hypothetical protein
VEGDGYMKVNSSVHASVCNDTFEGKDGECNPHMLPLLTLTPATFTKIESQAQASGNICKHIIHYN